MSISVRVKLTALIVKSYPPSSSNFIQAMSSPTHSTFQPGSVGQSIARLVFPHALGKAAAMYFFSPAGLVTPRICENLGPKQTRNVYVELQTDIWSSSLILNPSYFLFHFLPAYVLQATPLLWQDAKQCGEQSISSPAGNSLRSHYRKTQFVYGRVCEQ